MKYAILSIILGYYCMFFAGYHFARWRYYQRLSERIKTWAFSNGQLTVYVILDYMTKEALPKLWSFKKERDRRQGQWQR